MTIPKTPQHNGVAEQMNHTIVERAKCMLSNAKFPRCFWGEAIKAAVNLINLSLVVPLKGDMQRTGKYPSYDYLKVFGCKAFMHIPKDERSKLDGKSKQCIFLGYGYDEFSYRLWDPVEKKLVRSRDVYFLKIKPLRI